MKVRKLQKRLEQLGCVADRCKGSHQVWVTPARQSFSIKVNHRGDDVTPGMLSMVRRVLREEGLSL